jgi:hypothetical protein
MHKFLLPRLSSTTTAVPHIRQSACALNYVIPTLPLGTGKYRHAQVSPEKAANFLPFICC